MTPHVPIIIFLKTLWDSFRALYFNSTIFETDNALDWFEKYNIFYNFIYILNAVPMLELCEIGDINLILSVPKRFPILHCTFWLLFQMHNCPTLWEWFIPTLPRPRSSGHFGTRTSIKTVGVMRWRVGFPRLIEPPDKLYLLTRTPRRTFYLPR